MHSSCKYGPCTFTDSLRVVNVGNVCGVFRLWWQIDDDDDDMIYALVETSVSRGCILYSDLSWTTGINIRWRDRQQRKARVTFTHPD